MLRTKQFIIGVGSLMSYPGPQYEKSTPNCLIPVALSSCIIFMSSVDSSLLNMFIICSVSTWNRFGVYSQSWTASWRSPTSIRYDYMPSCFHFSRYAVFIQLCEVRWGLYRILTKQKAVKTVTLGYLYSGKGVLKTGHSPTAVTFSFFFTENAGGRGHHLYARRLRLNCAR